MKKKLFLFIFIFSLFFSSIYTYADNNEVSNSSEYIDTSIYHSFINYLVAHDGDKYSKYFNNMHCTIYELPTDGDYFAKFSTRGGYASYLNFNSKAEQQAYQQNTENNLVPYATHIAFFTSKSFVYNEIDKYYTFSNNNYHFSEQLTLPDDGELYFIMIMRNNLDFTIYNFYFNNKADILGFNFDNKAHLIYTDDTIYYNNSNIVYSNSIISNLELLDFNITENESGISLYQKVMALYNNEYNTYARLWADGDKPTVAIFDNSNTNCIIPLLDSNNYIQNKYIAVFSTCRLCEYIQNNNSRHYNTLTYGNEFLHILTFDVGTNNYTFYNLMGRNYQNDVILLTGTSGDELLLCNSNIIQKSNANDFILTGNNEFTYLYYSDLELLETYPINNSTNSNGSSDVWSQISDSINNSTNTFTGFMGEMFNEIYDITTEFISDTAVPFFSESRDTIASVLPFHVIDDFIKYIQNFVTEAEEVRDTIIANNGYDFSFTLLNKNFTFNPLHYLFTTDLYKYAKLFCNLSFFSFIVLRIYRDVIFILSNAFDDSDI